MRSYRKRVKRLEDRIQQLKAAKTGLASWPDNPVVFCTENLGFTPTLYQEKLLLDNSQFIAARMARQCGKTHCMAALVLWLCLKNKSYNVIVVAPSIRQSKIIIRKIATFLPLLPRHSALKTQKTKITFYNNSRVQAFPNSPETIRGEPRVNMILADEAGYIRDDKDLYDAVIFTLVTTNGRFIATSTPGPRDSLFYAMCTDDESFGDVSRHHVTYLDALEPKGPLKHEILEKLKKQFATDPWRWRREMEAEFSDDSEAWLPIALIRKCVDENLEYIPEDSIITS